MKKILLALLLAAPLTAWSSLITVNSFNDIQNWTGSGSNQSALVLQWNDGGSPASLTWGYLWNGSATGLQLLSAVAGTTIIREPGGGDAIQTLRGADPALTLTLERYNFGDVIYSIDYAPGGVVRTQADWESGYWEYFLHGGNFQYSTWNGSGFSGPFLYNVAGSASYAGVNWWSSQIGLSDRGLINGSWDAYSFAAGFTNRAIIQPSAAVVPEPHQMSLLLFAAVACALIGLQRIRNAA